MTEENWEVVGEISGPFQAEIIRGLLEAQEIPVVLSQDGIGRVYSLTIGTAGLVQVFVPAKDFQRAKKILDDFQSGALEDQSGSEELE